MELITGSQSASSIGNVSLKLRTIHQHYFESAAATRANCSVSQAIQLGRVNREGFRLPGGKYDVSRTLREVEGSRELQRSEPTRDSLLIEHSSIAA
jgi:hypothetical protein